VSLPFSDHCELLADDSADVTALFMGLDQEYRKHKNRYFELRATSNFQANTDLSCSSEELYLHEIDLTPDLGVIFKRFHKSSTQRKIMRAEREKLTYQEGRSQALLEIFFELTILTRRRHGLPPQPLRWFRNVLDCMGESATIMVAYKDDRPIASIFTLRHGKTLTYKYGCSDARFHNLGGTHFLFWHAMHTAKGNGVTVFDLGRSTVQNEGLIRFKERWGAKRSSLFYMTFAAAGSARGASPHSGTDWKMRYAKRFFKSAPNSVLSFIGTALYRHIG
jgi:lipid II:glycine glycyltransferase (peptidoglycan interpeptide bridge formation enzyme)